MSIGRAILALVFGFGKRGDRGTGIRGYHDDKLPTQIRGNQIATLFRVQQIYFTPERRKLIPPLGKKGIAPSPVCQRGRDALSGASARMSEKKAARRGGAACHDDGRFRLIAGSPGSVGAGIDADLTERGELTGGMRRRR